MKLTVSIFATFYIKLLYICKKEKVLKANKCSPNVVHSSSELGQKQISIRMINFYVANYLCFLDNLFTCHWVLTWMYMYFRLIRFQIKEIQSYPHYQLLNSNATYSSASHSFGISKIFIFSSRSYQSRKRNACMYRNFAEASLAQRVH